MQTMMNIQHQINPTGIVAIPEWRKDTVFRKT